MPGMCGAVMARSIGNARLGLGSSRVLKLSEGHATRGYTFITSERAWGIQRQSVMADRWGIRTPLGNDNDATLRHINITFRADNCLVPFD